ncbi:hypothetical protein [Nocardia sputi]|uniref:hypothetical protein n=1 Tax=Nocardia sputi TaxID=2943705 RepID=UPI0020BE0A1F|nr:hypothetical protein [Nocardia sputi]
MSDTPFDNPPPAGPDREQQLRELYQAAAIPYALRRGPIDHDYRLQARQDSIHASCLREVQNLSALSARLSRGRSYLALTEVEQARLDLTFNALNGARFDADREGVPLADIDAAETAGKTGTPWIHGPGHHYLGRIEQLAEELRQAHDLIDAQKQTIAELGTQTSRDARRISDLEQRLDREHSHLAQAWSVVEDYRWETGVDRTPAPLPHWMNALRDQAAENHIDTDPASAGTGAESGQEMGAAIEALDDGTGAWAPHDGTPAPGRAPGSEAGPEVGP